LRGYEERREKSDFPGETFRVLKEKEIRNHGEYRTRRLVLAAWARLEAVDFDVNAYTPMTDPPPADPRVAHPCRDGSVYTGQGLVIREQESVNSGQSSVVSNQQASVSSVQEEQADYAPDAVVEEDVPAEVPQTEVNDFGLYKCQSCGQMVMGFGKDEHVKSAHKGKGVVWERMG